MKRHDAVRAMILGSSLVACMGAAAMACVTLPEGDVNRPNGQVDAAPGAHPTPGVEPPLGMDGGVAPLDGAVGADSGIERAPAAVTLATVTLTSPAYATVTAGDKVLALFATKDLAIVDLREPKSPRTTNLVTPGKVLAADYDELRSLAFVVDTTGYVGVLNLASASEAAFVTGLTVPALAQSGGKAITRVGDRLYVLTGANIVALRMTMQGDSPASLAIESTLALPQPAAFLASGAGVLYVGYAGGTIESWVAAPTPTRVGSFAGGGPLVSLLGKGSTVLALVRDAGLRVVDFGAPTAPRSLAELGDLKDGVDARLAGRLLLVALGRGEVVTVDLSSYSRPRALTSNPGALPQYVAVVKGNVVVGTGASATVLGVPPFVSASVPSLTASAFPLDGRLPVMFSKPVDPASVTSATVTMTCNGAMVAGTPVVAPDGLSVSFQPASALPANATCVLDVSGVKDMGGMTVAAAGKATVSVRTAPAGPLAQASNGKSAFVHTTDGRFTGYTAPDGGAGPGVWTQGEWADIRPMRGMYSYFYADFDGENLFTLNDWFHNDENIDPDCYNEFDFSLGRDRWQIRAYGNQTVKAVKNGQPVDPAAAGVQGSAAYGGSPNLALPHTIYELKIPTSGGSWATELHDPTSAAHCSTLATDTNRPGGSLVADGGSTIGTLAQQRPAAPALTGPVDRATDVAITPQLTWTSSGAGAQLVGYRVQLSTAQDFSTNVRNGWAYEPRWVVPSGALAATQEYFWRVTAYNGAGSATSSTARFTTAARPAPGSWSLTTAVIGQGTVTSSPDGIACPEACTRTFEARASVQLRATAANGWRFVGWSGACSEEALDGGIPAPSAAGTARVTVNANLQCTAAFEQMATLSVTATAGGTVTSDVGGVSCGSGSSGVCTTSFPASLGQQVTLTATPAATYVFAGWSGDCTGAQVARSVTLSENRTCEATFAPTLGSVAVQNSPAAGGVVTSSNGLACGGAGAQVCEANAPIGSRVTLTAASASGYAFTGWSGACSGANATATVVVASGQQSCLASYRVVNDSYTLNATVSGLTTSGLRLHSGSDAIDVAADGSFTFPTSIEAGASYNVTLDQPTGQTCTVSNGFGTMGNSNVTATVSCFVTGGYSYAPGTQAFIDACAASGAVRVLPNIDDSVAPIVALPFNIRLYDTLYTQFAPTSNGYVVFGASPSNATVYSTTTLPSTSQARPAVFFFGGDLRTRAGGVCYATVGTAPNRQLVVEHEDGSYYADNAATTHLTMEVILNEADGSMDFVYRTIQRAANSATPPSNILIGSQNATGTYGNTWQLTTANQTLPVASGSSVHATPAAGP